MSKAVSPDRRVVPIHDIPMAAGSETSSEVHWSKALRVIRKHWVLCASFGVLLFGGLVLTTRMMKDVYAPVARLEIDPPEVQGWGARDLPQAPDWNKQDYLETQIEILKSTDLALATIQAAGLDKNGDFTTTSRPNFWTAAATRILDPERTATAVKKTPINIALESFRNRLSVEQVRNSRLVEVSVSSHDPELAAKATNTLVHLLIEKNYRTRYESTMHAANWLSEQLDDLRRQVREANEALAGYERVNGIVVDADTKENVAMQALGDRSRQLTQAQADRIQAEAYLMISTQAPDALLQMRDSVLAQNLRQHIAENRAQLARGLAIYGANNSNIKKLNSEGSDLEAQLAAERNRIVREVQAAYDSARAREQLLTRSLDGLKRQMLMTNGQMIQYRVLKNEAQTKQELYNTLVGRLREVALTSGLRSTSIRIADEARVLDTPSKPHRLQILGLGALMAILGAIAIAFMRESLDHTVSGSDEIREWTGISPVAMLPAVNGKTTPRLSSNKQAVQFFVERPHSPEAEAVRNLRAFIRLSRWHRPPKVLLVVSPGAREGKTTVSVNLAMALAQHGTVCLVDGDLRKPEVARSLGLQFERGVSDVLEGSADLNAALVRVPSVNNLSVLPARDNLRAAEQLTAWAEMGKIVRSLAARFDTVVIDSAPLLPFADARALTLLADGVVLVARCKTTERDALDRSFEILREFNAPLLGVVLNGVDKSSDDYKYYHYAS